MAKAERILSAGMLYLPAWISVARPTIRSALHGHLYRAICVLATPGQSRD